MSKLENKEIVDNYKEHKFHNGYDEHCSTCFKNIREFNGEDDDDEILAEDLEYDKTHSKCCDAIIVNGRCFNCKDNVE